jgi:hypothetical protein
MPGVVEGFTPGETTILLEGLVSQGTLVKVEMGAFAFHGEVLFCERRADKYEAHISINDVDESGLRRTPRFPVSIAGTVFAAPLAAPTPATIVDISGDGLGIELPVHLPAQTNIAVESESNVAFGAVRFSRALPAGGFRIGVELHHIVQREAARPNAAAVRTGLMGRMGSRFFRKAS